MSFRDSLVVDLDTNSRLALEFDELLDWVASFARTPLGAERVRALQPVAEEGTISAESRAVSETGRTLEAHGMLLPGSLPDPSGACDALGVSGMRLDPESLRDLATLGVAAGDLRVRLLDLDRSSFPTLRQFGERLPDLDRTCRTVLEGIGPDGRVQDSASAELRTIRRTMVRLGDRVQRLLVGILRDPGSEAIIQDDFITERNGRYVIPVRTDAPRPVEGIVHASSSSGATRFVEPMESVELNNELVRLAEEERAEEERVLAVWSEAYRRRLPEVSAMIQVVTRLDDLQARALFAQATHACPADVRTGAPIKLGGVRHPLLDRRLAESGERCVPLNLMLDPSTQILVISGPNTGGKTVALKTLGLAVLMSQSGIPVPADELQLPVYRQVRADIGDRQSIEADLSTYSAHIGAVVEYLKNPLPPSLYLFDEIGTGTEPTEGAALARAILETLERPEITAVATTHLGPLKAWAAGRDGVACAAMEFDLSSLRPTYRILMGVAGTSAGLDIAERLGLEPPIVGRARALLDPRAREGEDYLVRLRDLVAQAEDQREALHLESEALEARRVELEDAFRRKIDQSRRQATEGLDRAMRELRELGRRELDDLRDRRDRARLEKRWAKAESRISGLAAQQKSVLGRPSDEGPWRAAGEARRGMHVRVASLGQEGEVVGVSGPRVEVRLGSMTITTESADLQVREGDTPAPAAKFGRSGLGRSAATVEDGGATVSREIKLIGMRVDEALPALDRFLDGALLAGHEQVRVVHGHGTGRLKSAVREFLESHAQVATHRPGGPGEGGDGATVVTFR
jgi:DNA mismatch repair protein MutS2